MKRDKHIDDGNGIKIPTKTDDRKRGKSAPIRNKVGEALYEQRTYTALHGLITWIIEQNGFKFENANTKDDVVHDIMMSFLEKGDDDLTDLLGEEERPVIDFKKGYPESLKALIWQRTVNDCIDIFRYEQRRKYATPEDANPVNWLEYWDDWERWATWEPGVELEIEESDRTYHPKRLPRFAVSEAEQPTIDTLSLEEVLRMLPEGERQVVQLMHEGYRHREIAQKLGIKAAASRKRLERARTRLQSLYPQ